MSVWFIVAFATITLSVIFLFLTALAGVRYYNQFYDYEDTKIIKKLILLAFLFSILSLGFLFWKGMGNNAMVEEDSSQKLFESVEE